MLLIKKTYTYITRSLRLKFIFFLSLLFLFMGIVTFLFYISWSKQQLHDKLVEKGVILSENLAYNAAFGVALQDSELLSILINGIINRQDIAYVIIYDAKGRELSFKDPLYIRKIIRPVALPAESSMETVITMVSLSKGNSFYDIAVPIVKKTGIRPQSK